MNNWDPMGLDGKKTCTGSRIPRDRAYDCSNLGTECIGNCVANAFYGGHYVNGNSSGGGTTNRGSVNNSEPVVVDPSVGEIKVGDTFYRNLEEIITTAKKISNAALNSFVVSFLKDINDIAIARNQEIAGFVYYEGNQLIAIVNDVQDCVGSESCSSHPFKMGDREKFREVSGRILAEFHTHGGTPTASPNAYSTFSQGDLKLSNKIGVAWLFTSYRGSFLGTPQGTILRYNTGTHSSFYIDILAPLGWEWETETILYDMSN